MKSKKPWVEFVEDLIAAICLFGMVIIATFAAALLE